MATSSPPKPSTNTINYLSPNYPSRFSTKKPTLINFSTTHSVFQSKWRNRLGFDRIRVAGERRVSAAVVRCTAEGIERSIPFGRRSIGSTAEDRAAAAAAAGVRFGLPERFKVVALTAFVMCLCNADRVVMSVAIVPLAAKYGWSSSFLGIVQVKRTNETLLDSSPSSFFFLLLSCFVFNQSGDFNIDLVSENSWLFSDYGLFNLFDLLFFYNCIHLFLAMYRTTKAQTVAVFLLSLFDRFSLKMCIIVKSSINPKV